MGTVGAMRTHTFITLIMALCLASWSGCSDAGSGQLCVPGASSSCVCAGGLAGAQVCREDGSGFEPCDCTVGGGTSFGTPDGSEGDSDEPGTAADGSGGDGPPADSTGGANTDASTGAGNDTGGTGGNDTGGTGGNDTTTGGGNDTGGGGGDGCKTHADCPAEAPVCIPADGVCLPCFPGTTSCDGDLARLCEADGSAWNVVQDCTLTGENCNPGLGVCESPCGGFGKLAETNAGCAFWAVDLHNAVESTPSKYLDAQDAQFAIVASNTSETLPAQVTLTQPDGFGQQYTVPPQSLQTFLVPPSWGLDGTGRGAAFRLTSTVPIVAYQFNPYSNEDVFSNDATLLLPDSAQDTTYRVVTLPHSSIGAGFSAYVTLVGIEDVTTSVTVTPTASISGGGGLPSMGPGSPGTFTIDKGEVVNLETSSGDLTGTLVEANGPIHVFAGHTAARTDSDCCNDHLEHQLPPVSAWGRKFSLARTMARGHEQDYVRVVAGTDGTQVTLTGNNTGTWSLGAGQFQAFEIDGHVHVESNEPVLVARFLASSGEASSLDKACSSAADCGDAYVCTNGCDFKSCSGDLDCGYAHTCEESLYEPGVKGCRTVGDPAMTIEVPEEQWQEQFVFLTPDKYQWDYLHVVGPADMTLTLDGGAMSKSLYEPIPSTDHAVLRTLVNDGIHVLTADKPVSITVYGYDAAVSYAYSGAMGLVSVDE